MRSEQRTIEGVDYTCTQMPGMRAAMVSVRMMKMLGEPAFRWLSGAIGAKGRAPDVTEITFAFSDLVGGLSEDEVKRTFRDLFQGCLKCSDLAGTGAPGDAWENFDTHFAGRMMHLFAVVRFAMETNYKDVFLGIASLVGEDKTSEANTEG